MTLVGSLRIVSDSLQIRNAANNATRMSVAGADGCSNNLDVGGGLDVTGNISVTGTVDGVDVANLKTAKDSLSTSTSNSNGVTTTMNLLETTVQKLLQLRQDTAISNLVDSSPGALNTLNELAAAINDDASFSTTVNNNIATKLPLSGGTITGSILFTNTGNDLINFTGNATSDQRGIAFNNRSALTADYNDGYLRLNDENLFTNGVHSYGQFETSGVVKANGGVNVGNTNVINSSGQVVASRITGALPAIDGSA